MHTHVYFYIEMFGYVRFYDTLWFAAAKGQQRVRQKANTPGLHNKIPAHNIFARVWVAQKSFFVIGSG